MAIQSSPSRDLSTRLTLRRGPGAGNDTTHNEQFGNRFKKEKKSNRFKKKKAIYIGDTSLLGAERAAPHYSQLAHPGLPSFIT